jgi:hypothetical protein
MSTYVIYAGGAVGYAKNAGAAISGFNTSGYVAITTGAVNSSAGGLSGYTANTTISDCYATGKISIVTKLPAMIYVGGLAGYARAGTIERCYATGMVTAQSNYPYAGGLVGYNYDGNLVSQCYATENVRSIILVSVA